MFQLIEPHGGDASTFNEFLATRGEGIHHICTTSVSPDTFTRLKVWFASKGVKVGQSDTIDGAVQWHLFDTRESLGGFYLMVLGAAGGRLGQRGRAGRGVGSER